MWQLVINGPGYFDTNYELPEGVTQLGRADENDIVLSGDLVSRKHAKLHVKGDFLTLEDLGGRNGSKLNGKHVSGSSQPMKLGDVLVIGENTLKVRRPTEAEKASTEVVDTSGGGVKRVGTDLGKSVVVARDARDSFVRRVLDNLPFDTGPNPMSEPPTADEKNARSSATMGDEREGPLAWQALLLLYRVSEKLSAADSLQAFLDATTDLVMKHANATTGVVLIRHPSGVLVPSAIRHAGQLQDGEVPISDTIVDAALSHGKAIAVGNARDDARFAARESVLLYSVDQVLCIPIGTEAPFQGALYLNRPSSFHEPLEPLLDVCTAIAQLVHTGVQKFHARPGREDQLRTMLQRFHGPATVERRMTELGELGKHRTALEERQVTVMFADLTGFAKAVQLLPPDVVSHILSDFYRIATRLLFSFDGTVSAFVGDSVVALFGAPYPRGDDTLRAVRASMGLRAEWRRAIANRPMKELLELRVGLNTGKVLAGTVGTDSRLDYTAIGEPVNVASWLCSTAEAGQVLITGKTLAGIGARFDVNPLGERPLFGSKARTSIFEVLEEDHDANTLSGVRT